MVITQLFYDNADFFRFRDRCQRAGHLRADCAGHFAGHEFRASAANYANVRRTVAGNSGREAESAGDDEAAQFEVGVDHAIRQVRELMAAGVPGVHFYVLNKSPATVRVLEAVRRA